MEDYYDENNGLVYRISRYYENLVICGYLGKIFVVDARVVDLFNGIGNILSPKGKDLAMAYNVQSLSNAINA